MVVSTSVPILQLLTYVYNQYPILSILEFVNFPTPVLALARCPNPQHVQNQPEPSFNACSTKSNIHSAC